MPQWHVDQCDSNRIAGWINDEGSAEPVEITVNEERVAVIVPTAYRADLEAAGFGDGRRAFSFELAGYMRRPTNIVFLSYAGEILYSAEIAIPEMLTDEDRLALGARARWRRDESAPGLTWGIYMTGDTLWDRYCFHRDFTDRDRILEIGPGYGRLLRTAMERGIRWREFVGIDLSPGRVDKLTQQFGADAVRFLVADVNEWRSDALFDAIICSGTFEHLYPDCGAALRNIADYLAPQGMVLIDFIRTEHSFAFFEQSSNYLRGYTERELRCLFARSGFSVRDIERCILGTAADGQPVERFLVIAGHGAIPVGNGP
jgi:2-polyprenyl-3-methyl-5-hydroxy-6-metoxy-1,4-benzoquinol methylase